MRSTGAAATGAAWRIALLVAMFATTIGGQCDGGFVQDAPPYHTKFLRSFDDALPQCPGTTETTGVVLASLLAPLQVPWQMTGVCFGLQLDPAHAGESVRGTGTVSLVVAVVSGVDVLPDLQDYVGVFDFSFTLNDTSKISWISVNLTNAPMVSWSPGIWVAVKIHSCAKILIPYSYQSEQRPVALLLDNTWRAAGIRTQLIAYQDVTAWAIRAEGHTTSGVPPGWFCRPSAYGDGVCDCYCGEWDIDCVKDPRSISCPDGLCSLDVPGWKNGQCNLSNYWAYDGCQCECGGMIDPDCLYPSPIVQCPPAIVSPVCDTTTSTCKEKWSCNESRYGDGIICDCECGIQDPDCKVRPHLQTTCHDNFMCVSSSCVAPMGWSCSVNYYNAEDGCDCSCGAYDPDCDKPEMYIYGCEKNTVCSYEGICIRTWCGNNHTEGQEQCDGESGCGSDCQCLAGYLSTSTSHSFPCTPICGDGLAVGSEQCDNGTFCTNCTCDPGHYTTNPRMPFCSGCGNSFVDQNESCDGGIGCHDCLCQDGFEPTNPASTDYKATESVVPVGAIAGSTIVGIVAVCIVIFIAFIVWRRRVIQLGSTNEFRAQPDEIKLGPVIGQGSYGVVYKGAWRGTEVAVKVVSFEALQGDMSQLDKEVEIMRALRHPNILLFMCYAESTSGIFIVTEWMPKGSLFDVLQDTHPIPLRTRLSILLGIAKGMTYLHTNEPRIVHRDLKSSNILLEASFNAKICDFGLTIFAEKGKESEDDQTVGTLFWTAPEVLQGDECTTKSDVYAFGIIIWEVVTRETPYGEMNPHCVAQQVIAGGLRPEVRSIHPQPLVNLMRTCWDTDQTARPEFSQIVETWDKIDTDMFPLIKAEEAIAAPSGTVALVFTDIQGSTAMWEWNSAAMRVALKLHNDVVRSAIQGHNGFEVKTEGDAFMITFQNPLDALQFCRDAQMRLLSADWDPAIYTQECCATVPSPSGEGWSFRGVRVRMGIHVGEPEIEKTKNGVDYLGTCVNKASRVSSIATGGQIVVSTAARLSLEKDMKAIEGMGFFEELGPFALKGIAGKEIIHEFVLPELKRTFSTSVASRAAWGSKNEGEQKTPAQEELQGEEAQISNILDRFTKRDSKPAWAIDPSEVHISTVQVGRGNFGAVYKGEWRGQTVAVKKFFQQIVNGITLIEVEKQLSEVATLTALRHPSILLFMGASVQPRNMLMCAIDQKGVSDHISRVTEWMEKGSLRNILSAGKEVIDQPRALSILESVASGMTYLHSENIIHRDLKSPNILVSAKWDVKLSDFGLAAVKKANKTMTVCGTVAWMAPEVLEKGHYSEASDVYSFAMVMCEIVTRRFPFTGIPAVGLVSRISAGSRPQIAAADASRFAPQFHELMRNCWAPDPAARPRSFAAISTALPTIPAAW